MNSNEINKLIKELKIEPFLGVYAADELIDIDVYKKGVLICNTNPSNQIGEHWIALCLSKSTIIYYDSLNTNFYKSDFIQNFLKKHNKIFLRNNFQIQAFTSERCGIHSIVGCYVLSRKNNKRTFQQFLKSFTSLKLPERESLSLQYFLSLCNG